MLTSTTLTTSNTQLDRLRAVPPPDQTPVIRRKTAGVWSAPQVVALASQAAAGKTYVTPPEGTVPGLAPFGPS